MISIKAPRKLIEVALPLDDINAAASREKSIRHGHPSTLHLWWARRPLAAARAVLFAQLVNDPGYERHLQRGVNKERAQLERERLFDIIRDLVKWENTNNEAVLQKARDEIWKSWRETCALNRNHPQAAELFNPDKLPAFHDPFAGGGAIPLEAQRLGLEAYASDLNPVAVLINKAMIEIPPKFANRAPVGPVPADERQMSLQEEWRGAQGLAEDVRRYGHWVRERAAERIGHLYPQVKVVQEKNGTYRHATAEELANPKAKVESLTVIAWLWARTVVSPNPAYSHVHVPLASTFMLSTKQGREAWIEPIVKGDTYHFEVRTGKPKNNSLTEGGTKATGRGANFICILSDTPISGDYIKAEGKAGRIRTKLMAVVVEGKRGRVYLPPIEMMEKTAIQAAPSWQPNGSVPERLTGGTCYAYGMTEWSNLFTQRQLVALNAFSDLVGEARERAKEDALAAGWQLGEFLADGGDGAQAYADAVAVYLGLAVSRSANTLNSLAIWSTSREQSVNLFSRQAIPMAWDFPEVNPFADAAGDFAVTTGSMGRSLATLASSNNIGGHACQANATEQILSARKVISTDPPYYDNIAYADLSDFFYTWLRRSLSMMMPDLFATLAVPKVEELVAMPHRHGDLIAAERFFLDGMTRAMSQLADQAHHGFPITIYYAFKQSDSNDLGTASTGWETFLEGVIKAGFSITGTWPMRTERPTGVKVATNALASSIILVGRQRTSNAPTISRREFLRELKDTLPEALDEMIGGRENVSPIAPVDLAQAAIGPGMGVFSQYAAVLEADGSRMSVHTALTLINKAIDDYFAHAEGELDGDSQFCVNWFSEYGWSAGAFGDADVLSRAKGTSVDAVRESGVIESGAGKVRLLRPSEYPDEWNPRNDSRVPTWEALHHLIRAFQAGGDGAAGALLTQMPARAEPIRSLAYRLYTFCERKGWAEDARPYNELITAWHEVERVAQQIGRAGEQTTML